MEDELDRIEEGAVDWRTPLGEFYPPFKRRLEQGKVDSEEIIKEILAAEGESCDKCGRPMLVRWNKYGRFLGCSGYPECQSTRSLDGPAPDGEELGTHPGERRKVLLKVGPYGPYVELESESEGKKPKRVSLPKGKELAAVDLDYALKLLSLPRPVGTDTGTGEEIVAGIGRFGPFVRRGKTFASLPGYDALWTVTLDEAVGLLEAKASGKRATLKELGNHPQSGEPIVVLAGRFGPYVTDGSVNATLPKDTEPGDLDMDTALDLLSKAAARKGKRGGGRGRARRGRNS
jgi:DNA topoisomerase-1